MRSRFLFTFPVRCRHRFGEPSGVGWVVCLMDFHLVNKIRKLYKIAYQTFHRLQFTAQKTVVCKHATIIPLFWLPTFEYLSHEKSDTHTHTQGTWTTYTMTTLRIKCQCFQANECTRNVDYVNINELCQHFKSNDETKSQVQAFGNGHGCLDYEESLSFHLKMECTEETATNEWQLLGM